MSLYPTPQSRGGAGLAWDLTLASFQKKSLGTQVPEGMGHGKVRPWLGRCLGRGFLLRVWVKGNLKRLWFARQERPTCRCARFLASVP